VDRLVRGSSSLLGRTRESPARRGFSCSRRFSCVGSCDLCAFLKGLGEESESLGSYSSVKAAVPHRHDEIFTRKDERRREMQRVETSQLVGERELGRTLDEVLVDLDHTERRPFLLHRPNS
jgi:hypothetical protein